MAYYNCGHLWYRGRLFEVTYRYHIFMSAHQKKGKPLRMRGRDWSRLIKLAMRKPELKSARNWAPEY